MRPLSGASGVGQDDAGEYVPVRTSTSVLYDLKRLPRSGSSTVSQCRRRNYAEQDANQAVMAAPSLPGAKRR